MVRVDFIGSARVRRDKFYHWSLGKLSTTNANSVAEMQDDQRKVKEVAKADDDDEPDDW